MERHASNALMEAAVDGVIDDVVRLGQWVSDMARTPAGTAVLLTLWQGQPLDPTHGLSVAATLGVYVPLLRAAGMPPATVRGLVLQHQGINRAMTLATDPDMEAVMAAHPCQPPLH